MGNECRSQILVTTQDIPEELIGIGSKCENRWYSRNIPGLNEAEQLELFQKRGLELDAAGQEYVRRIGYIFDGHALFLRVVAEDVKALNGNIERYWQDCKFADLEVGSPIRLSRQNLRIEVQNRVRESIRRLTADAYQLLCCASVYRCPVPESFWLALLIIGHSENAQHMALDFLRSRGLAEDGDFNSWYGEDGSIPLRQHPLIRNVAYELLKNNEVDWKDSERKAAEIWMNSYEPASNIPRLETVRGYLEAFHHLLTAQDVEEAFSILELSLDTEPESELKSKLHTWGYYREEVQIYRKLAKESGESGNSTIQVSALINLADAQHYLSLFDQALENGKKALHISRTNNNRSGEARALRIMANAYYALGNLPKAKELYNQCLPVLHEIDDRLHEALVLGNIGLIYQVEGEYELAIDSLEQNLNIVQSLRNRQREGSPLGTIGFCYYCMGEYSKAIEYYQRRIRIAREFDDRMGEASGMGNMAAAYAALENYDEAIKLAEDSLEIMRELDAKRPRSSLLGLLANIYFDREQYALALETYQQYLKISLEIKNRRGEAVALLGLGNTLFKLDKLQEALSTTLQCLQICSEINLNECKAKALRNLAGMNLKLSNIDEAQRYCNKALSLSEELGIPLVSECKEIQQEIDSIIQ